MKRDMEGRWISVGKVLVNIKDWWLVDLGLGNEECWVDGNGVKYMRDWSCWRMMGLVF